MSKHEGLRVVGLLAFAVLFGAQAGCGGAEVRVAFDHAGTAGAGQALTLADGHTPEVFGIKLVGIYLAEDVSPTEHDNIGNVGRIWTNPACDEDGYRCSINADAGPYQVKDFFDLALPSAAVNARLNSQGASIKAGTYRYLRMDLVGIDHVRDQAMTNVRFGAQANTAHEIRLNDNNYLVPLEPPMVVRDGDTVTVTLGYDLASSFYDGPDLNGFQPPTGTPLAEWYCGDTSHTPARGPCLHFTTFEPRVTGAPGPAGATPAAK